MTSSTHWKWNRVYRPSELMADEVGMEDYTVTLTETDEHNTRLHVQS